MTTAKYKNLSLIALCFGYFMVIIDVTIVNVALPSISKNLGENISWLQWVVDGYTLMFACLLLSAGNLADRIGAKSVYLFGLGLFTITSLACGLSFHFLQLTILRMLQGVGAALLVPTSLSLINASYENKKERVTAIGIWGAISAVAAATGPIVGGILTFYFGWRSVFFVNVPFGIIAFALTKKFVVNPAPSGKGHFDLLGQLFGIISIAALAFSLIEAGRFGWNSEIVFFAFIIFILALIFFIMIENKTLSPMFPLHFFRSEKFSVMIALGMLLNIAWYGELFVLTLYFQNIRHYSVLMTGFAFIPYVGMNMFAAYWGGKLASKIGPRIPMLIGSLIGVSGFFSMLFVSQQASYWMLIFPLIGMGAGIAVFIPPAVVSVIHAVPEDRAGIASGAFNASRQVGSLMGVAIFGTMIALSNHFMDAMHDTLIFSGLIFLIGGAAVFVWIKKEE